MFTRNLRNLTSHGSVLLQSTTTAASSTSMLRRSISAFVEQEKFVVVQEQKTNPRQMKFPTVWLRDNCRCSDCFHESSQSRRISWENFNTDVRVLELQTDKEAKQIKIKWDDRHQSTFELQWLKEREFRVKRTQKYLLENYRPKTLHWRGGDFQQICEIFDFQDVMTKDEVLKNWLEALAVRGVAIIKNSPLEKSVVRQLADRVGFIRRTSYGEEFIVQSKPGAKNYAYLSDPLPLHTDLPYYEYKPGVNILHCMVQSKSQGGCNLLVDGFNIADLMRARFPRDYKILTQTIVDWNDIATEEGKSFHNIWRSPVICLDADGNYTRINHSVPQRDNHFSVELDEVIPWYEAYAKFVRLAHQDAYAFKTQPGDILTFNNIRLMHGRTGYDDTEENVRYIVGAYLDWDIIYSKLRVLKTTTTPSTETEEEKKN